MVSNRHGSGAKIGLGDRGIGPFSPIGSPPHWFNGVVQSRPSNRVGHVPGEGQGLSLAKQVGMSAREEIDPRNVIVVAAFDSGKDQRYQMLAVKKPASPEEIEDIKDWMVDNGGRCSGWHCWG